VVLVLASAVEVEAVAAPVEASVSPGSPPPLQATSSSKEIESVRMAQGVYQRLARRTAARARAGLRGCGPALTDVASGPERGAESDMSQSADERAGLGEADFA
jgi:hypothetical protein